MSEIKKGMLVKVVDRRSSNEGRYGRVVYVNLKADRPIAVRLDGDNWNHYYIASDLQVTR